MSASLGILIALTALAQPWAPPSAGGGVPAEEYEIVEMKALRASNEGMAQKEIDPALRGLAPVLEALPFDRFSPIAEETKEAPYGRETLIPINSEYTLSIRPIERNAKDGLVLLEARIIMSREGRKINALSTRAEAATGQPLLFRGLELNNGELVVVMRLAQQDDGSQGSGESTAQDQEKPEQQEAQEQEEQETPPEEQQEETQPGEEENDQAPPPAVEPKETAPEDEKQDMQNIEALLQSLEEMDRREQQELRNQRDHIDVRKGWW